MVLLEIGTHGVLDAAMGGYRDGERSLTLGLAPATGAGDLVIADRGFWSAEVVDAFTATGADLLVRLLSNHLGTVLDELADGSVLSTSTCSKRVRRRAREQGRTPPAHIVFRVISYAAGENVVHLGTTLIDHQAYPAEELVGIYRERWEIELAFDELKNHLGPSGPLRSRTTGTKLTHALGEALHEAHKVVGESHQNRRSRCRFPCHGWLRPIPDAGGLLQPM